MSEKPKTRLVHEIVSPKLEDGDKPVLHEKLLGPAWFATRWPDDAPIKAEDALREWECDGYGPLRLIAPPEWYAGAWWVATRHADGSLEDFGAATLTLLPEPEREERCEYFRYGPNWIIGGEAREIVQCQLTHGHDGPHEPDLRTHQRREGERRASGQRRRPQPSFYQTNDRRSSISRRRNADDRRTGKDRRS